MLCFVSAQAVEVDESILLQINLGQTQGGGHFREGGEGAANAVQPDETDGDSVATQCKYGSVLDECGRKTRDCCPGVKACDHDGYEFQPVNGCSQCCPRL